MRYVLMIVGALGLAIGFLMFAKDSPKATVTLQLGGVFLAVGLATSDIVEAIKGNRRS
jgi:hypothetical protein